MSSIAERAKKTVEACNGRDEDVGAMEQGDRVLVDILGDWEAALSPHKRLKHAHEPHPTQEQFT